MWEFAQPQNPTAILQAAKPDMQGAAKGKLWGAQHYGPKENWNSALQGWRVLFPVSNLRGIGFLPLCGFGPFPPCLFLHMYHQGPEAAVSAKVPAVRCFVDRHLRKRQRLSLIKQPWHPQLKCCRLTRMMGPRRKCISYLSWGPIL